jgi:GYF domain 2
MADSYLLHFSDGTEWGPVNRTTLEEWHRQGRIPRDALVWPDGAPEWLPIDAVLSRSMVAPGPQPLPAPEPEAPAGQQDESTKTRPPRTRRRAASRAGPAARVSSRHARALLLVTGGVALVLVLLGALLALLRPALARRQAVAAIERYALADRRVGGGDLGFVIDLPTGWVALRDDNPYEVSRGARLRLAHPVLGAFGAVRVAARPELMGDLDRWIDEILQGRLAARPSQREEGRADVQLGRGQGRLVRTSWQEDLERREGATAVWRDGYQYYSLEAWAPASAGPSFLTAFEELLRGVTPSGAVSARIDEAAESLAVEVPELSREGLRLLIGERLSRGDSLDGVPLDALREVGRGLPGLSPAEAEEMRQIYGKVWAPVPEEERLRLARIRDLIRAERPVPTAEARELRDAIKTGVLALPAEQRERLQELSGRALEKSLVLR